MANRQGNTASCIGSRRMVQDCCCPCGAGWGEDDREPAADAAGKKLPPLRG